jgi:hypothetical protein
MEPNADQVREQFKRAFDEVPSIGEGHRWYDFPDRFLRFLLRGWPKKLIRRSMYERIVALVNYLLQFNTHERNLVLSREDPLHSLKVPADEHVSIPGIWVIELFPPSEYGRLTKTIKSHDWGRRGVTYGLRGANDKMLDRSRTGRGWTWWRLGEVESGRGDLPYRFPDASQGELPSGIGAVELIAVQIGAGLTAVWAHFHLTDAAMTSLDQAWHRDYEPEIITTAGVRKASDRLWTSFTRIQQARRALHDSARGWLAKECPGFFTTSGKSQPLLDLLLLNEHDPTGDNERDRPWHDALRALGVTGHDVLQRISPDLPGLLLVPVEPDLCPALEGERTWSLFGQVEAAASKIAYLDYYGSDPARAIANKVHDVVRNFFILLAVSDLLRAMEEKHASLRDQARSRHGRPKISEVKELRATFLTLSLDLSSVARDVLAFYKSNFKARETASFQLDYAPRIVREDEAAGRPRFQVVDLNEQLEGDQSRWLATLAMADKDYRDILSTVASLGATVETSRIGRIAVWIAVASLAVSAVTLLVSGVERESPLVAIRDWLSSLF